MIVTISTVVVTFDPKKDVKWAKGINRRMTRDDFELIDFAPGMATYQQEFEEVYK